VFKISIFLKTFQSVFFQCFAFALYCCSFVKRDWTLLCNQRRISDLLEPFGHFEFLDPVEAKCSTLSYKCHLRIFRIVQNWSLLHAWSREEELLWVNLSVFVSNHGTCSLHMLICHLEESCTTLKCLVLNVPKLQKEKLWLGGLWLLLTDSCSGCASCD